MATQGSPLLDVNITGAPLDSLAPIPIGALTDDGGTVMSRIATASLTNRFPTPPAAFGFLINVVDEDYNLAYKLDALTSPYVINGALNPPGQYLEPTIGQIWPRVG
jgi:hypothetical protein